MSGLDEYMDKQEQKELKEKNYHKPGDTTELPEAPASATVKIKSPNGYEWLYTVRDTKAGELITKMSFLERVFQSEGWTPLTQGYQKTSQKQPKPENLDPNAPICSIHNRKMDWKTGVSKTSGKPYAFWSCSIKNPDGSWCQYKPQTNYKPDQIQ